MTRNWQRRVWAVLMLGASAVAFGVGGVARGQDDLAALLAEPGVDLADPPTRERIVARLKELAETRRDAARQRAAARGLPLRVTRANGVIQEIAGFEGETPVYLTTHNANAAISTGANLVRSALAIDGGGVTIGMWDGGSGRATHQEFGTRMVVKDGAAAIDHATHVGGTLAAFGVVASARGMAPGAVVDSYDWNSDISEMTSRGATAPGQAGRIHLSNHSYGFVSGWNDVSNGTRVWEWYGNGTASTGVEQDFGRYNSAAREQDVLAYNAPYYLIFRSAGNDRLDNPTPGQWVALSPGSSSVVAYDPALHPAGDGQYRGGFETIGYAALAKNVVTVGSVTDAVDGSSRRSLSRAAVSTFSSWGPTDDGRIKPDLVANGESVYSSLGGSNTSYGNSRGTSMAAPNATGSAALLIQHYANLFSGGVMRASTLKGLLIHTADDLGLPGPDYKFGWGLVNAKAAADLLGDHQAQPSKLRLTEHQLTTTTPSHSHPFVWDGVSPIRATLSWTDPAGSSTSTSDLRSPRLVNNLNLKLIGPGGSEHFPYVMPFVGTWTQASMDSAATTGINHTDNVEQVNLAAPPAAGVYQAVISFSGTLTNGRQQYSVLIDGSSGEPPPPPPLTVSAVSPTGGAAGMVTIDLSGSGFQSGTTVALARAGQPLIPSTQVQLVGQALRCQFNLTGAAAGLWDIVVTNPDLATVTLPAAFTVTGAIWSEAFDGSPTGWVTTSTRGSNSWKLSSEAAHSPTRSYFAPAPSSRTTTRLTSPAISIPAGATDMQLRFWHRYDLQSGWDGGRIEISTDNGGSWFSVESSNSGVAFASNGYNETMRIFGSGLPGDFAGLRAWTGNSGGFIETILNLTNTAKFAGKTVRFRWVIATNSITSSPGWRVDSISLTGGGNVANTPPLLTAAPSGGSGDPVTDPELGLIHQTTTDSIGLSVTADDDGGEAALTYTWSLVEGPGAAVVFSPNAGNAAKSTVAAFDAPGDYRISAAVSDAEGLTTAETLRVRVIRTASDLGVTPATASVTLGTTLEFQAARLDQFGDAMPPAAEAIVWSASGGGTIGQDGTYAANSAGGPFVIQAAAGGLAGIATVTVLPGQAAVSLENLHQVFDGSPRPVTALTDPAGLAVAIHYGQSMTPPVFPGSYEVVATVGNPDYQGSATGTLVISGTTYDDWQAAHFTAAAIAAGDAAPDSDPDRDGLANLAEFALGTDPGSFTPPPAATLDGEFLTLGWTRPKGRPEAVTLAETSGDLIEWSAAEIEIIDETATTDTLRARVPRPPPQSGGPLFLRLRFEPSPTLGIGGRNGRP